MILQRQHFDLDGRAVLERFVFRPPMEVKGNMEGEACFILPLKGKVDAFNALDRLWGDAFGVSEWARFAFLGQAIG